MGIKNRKVKRSVDGAIIASCQSVSTKYLPAQTVRNIGSSSRNSSRSKSVVKNSKQSESSSLVMMRGKMDQEGNIVNSKNANVDGESKMKNVRLSMGISEAYHTPNNGSPGGGIAVEDGGEDCVANCNRHHQREVASPCIDLVTPQWVFLSNNKRNKETHSFTLPPPPSQPFSFSSPTSISSLSTFPSCASAHNRDPSNTSGVSEEETIKPLGANLEQFSNCQHGQQQRVYSPHKSKPLVLTHDQRNMKRRTGKNGFIFRDSVSSFSRFSSNSLLFGLMFIIASLIHSSHEQSFFSPSSDEWDGGSFRSGTYGNGYTCVNIPVNFTLCKNIGYTKMMIPNLLGHDSLQEAEFHAKSWVPLLGLQCHPDTQLFLCSLFSPICLDRPIYPCRSLCQGVQAKCEPRMLAYNYPWPSMLKCDQFPEDHDLCIRPGAANKSEGDPELECPSCNQAHTCENIVDNFCRAEFVFRAKYKKSKGAMVEFRKERWFKPRDGNRRGRELRTLSLDSKDDCCATKLRQGFPYIVMGVKRGDEYVITFAMQWNPKDKILKNAVRTFRSMDCTNPLPMSVTAAGGKLGAERNGTTAGAGRRRRRKQGRRQERQYGGCRVSAPGRKN